MTVQEPKVKYFEAKNIEELEKEIVLFMNKHERLGQLVEIVEIDPLEGENGIFAIVEYSLSDLQK